MRTYNKKIQFAIIGTSGIAPIHIQSLRKCHRAKILYVYSRNYARAKKFAENFGLTPVKSYEDILNDKTINAVDIVTEPSRHGILALQAMKHGKHVLIEKPLDNNIVMAEKVMDEATKVPTVTSVISQQRFDPIIKIMKKKLDVGSIGKPYLAKVSLLWKRTYEYYNAGNGWRGEYGNVLLNQSIHWLDIAIWLWGSPTNISALITKVKNGISCYDTAIVCLKYPNNILFNLTCSTASHESQPVQFTIHGEKDILDYTSIKYSTRKFITSKLNKITTFLNILRPSKIKHIKSPLEYQIEDFVDAIITNRTPTVSVADAYAALKIVKYCEESYAKQISKS